MALRRVVEQALMNYTLPRTIHAPRTNGLLSLLVAGYVILIPYLFNVGDRINFAPADLFLATAILLASGQMRLRLATWSAWHLGIVLTFALGSFTAALRYGRLDRYELLNKDAGLLLPLLSYFAITSVIRDWNDLRQMMRIFAISVVLENIAAIGAFLAAYYWGIVTQFTRYEGLRLSGMLLDPNAYGGLLVVALVMCEAGSWGEEPLLKVPTLWVSRLTLGLGILFTFSRSAWVGLGLAGVLLVLLRPGIAVRALLSGLAAAPFVVLVLGHRFLPIFFQMARRPEQVRQRIDLIHQAMESFVQRPLLGGGLGSFRLAGGEVAHNSALWFLADFGLAGLITFTAFVLWFVQRAWLAYRLAPVNNRPLALALLLAHTAMIGVAMGIEAFYQRHWWLILALIASCYALVRRPFGTQQTSALRRAYGQ